MGARVSVFRVALEVSDLSRARDFYSRLLASQGRAVGGGRHYYDCDGVILALVDVTPARRRPRAGGQDLYLAVSSLRGVHARARALRCLSNEGIHGEPGGAIVRRPWGERSFYAVDPFGNKLCFVDRKTLFTGR